jgi:hypothetical protein
VTDFETAIDTEGVPMERSGDGFSYAYYTFTVTSENEVSIRNATYIEVRILPDDVDLAIISLTDASSFPEYVGVWSQLFNWVQTSQPLPSNSDSSESAVEFIMEPGVSDEASEAIFEGTRLAQEFVLDELGLTMDDTLYVTGLPTPSPVSPDINGSAFGSGIVLYTGSATWTGAVAPLLKIGFVVHEYVHAYHGWASNGENSRSPAWFEEGMAEYLSAAAMARLQVSDLTTIEELYSYLLFRSPHSAPLEQLVSPIAFQAQGASVYQLSYFAIAHLFSFAGADMGAAVAYYSSLRSGSTFEDAFQAAFGISIHQFYQEFERVRESFDNVTVIPNDFKILESPQSPSPIFLTDTPSLLVGGYQILVVAETAPASVCRLIVVLDGAAESLTNRKTMANGSGEMFWLLTVPQNVRPGIATITVACGTPHDQIEVLVA